MSFTLSEMEAALKTASKGKAKRPDVAEFLDDPAAALRLLADVESGRYKARMRYREMDVESSNGKTRRILRPDFYTLVIQHLSANRLWELYLPQDPMVGLNCKQGCGITSKTKRGSVLKRAKRVCFDLRQYSHVTLMDQRKCYAHITRKAYRRALCLLGSDKAEAAFHIEAAFHGGSLPVGTPTSPLVHHVVMLAFDRWLMSVRPHSIRYADNVCVFSQSLGEAHEIKWRIRNFWWYRLGMRAKRHDTRIIPIDSCGFDFCGYVLHRNPGKGACSHDKGYVTLRPATARRLRRTTPKGWPSYFGIARHADAFSLLTKTERKMNLRQLTDTIRIDRKMDAPNIPVKDLAEQEINFTIHDYEIRCDPKKNPNWLKCLISFPAMLPGKRELREFHGGYSSLVSFLLKAEAAYGRDAMLPITDVSVANQCGYIFRDSTNMRSVIDDCEIFNP